MPKYPSEIFGHPYFNRSEEAEKARENHWCPFVDQECYKQSRLVEIPFGVCSAHINGEDVAVCPRRFLDKNTIFGDIALHHFGSVNDILVFSEVRLPKTGSFDFVMLKHAPLSIEIEDFIIIEFQTGQTTGKQHSTVFAMYNLVSGEKKFELAASRMTSASTDQLFNAFRNSPDIPSKDEFIGVLQSKIEAEVHLKLDLHRAGERKSLDVKPPTSTGRLRDRQAKQPSLFDDID